MEDQVKGRLLPLDERRNILLTIGKTPINFIFKPIEQPVWRRFCEALVTRVEQKNGERFSYVDEESALAELFEKTCTSAAGYKDAAPGFNASRVPLRHRIAAASVLRSIGTELADADAPSLSEFTEIRLNAPWSIGANNQMEMFTGLVHRFKEPTIEQFARFRRGCARVAVTGTAQNGTTVYPSRLAVALGLYDELIAEVEGYSWVGAPLGVAQARESMDGMHKARAVLELFDRDGEEITVGGTAQEQQADGAAA